MPRAGLIERVALWRVVGRGARRTLRGEGQDRAEVEDDADPGRIDVLGWGDGPGEQVGALREVGRLITLPERVPLAPRLRADAREPAALGPEEDLLREVLGRKDGVEAFAAIDARADARGTFQRSSTTSPTACFIVTGAPTVIIELGMAGITGSTGFSNKGPGG